MSGAGGEGFAGFYFRVPVMHLATFPQTARVCVVVCLSMLVGVAGFAQEPVGPDRFWPQWRGPLGTGVAPHGTPPVEWSESTNVRWKVEIPGRGSSTPVIWGDRLFVLTAVPTGDEGRSQGGLFTRLRRRIMGGVAATYAQRFMVLAIDRRDGRVIWERVAREELPHEGTHQTGTWASPSAVTDGEVVCAFFGSRGLYCYDLDGRPLWETDLGDMRIRMGFGEGASPTLYSDLLIVLWDHEGDSFIVAFDKRTGRELWSGALSERSTATPMTYQTRRGRQFVLIATGSGSSQELVAFAMPHVVAEDPTALPRGRPGRSLHELE